MYVNYELSACVNVSIRKINEIYFALKKTI